MEEIHHLVGKNRFGFGVDEDPTRRKSNRTRLPRNDKVEKAMKSKTSQRTLQKAQTKPGKVPHSPKRTE
ncbi:hypothetical protein TNCV_4175471 [Trichonephila clavipes]|nr:hypothetical protein TNCV_4175471 [Trichonephila clavipes]